MHASRRWRGKGAEEPARHPRCGSAEVQREETSFAGEEEKKKRKKLPVITSTASNDFLGFPTLSAGPGPGVETVHLIESPGFCW